jgi:predicted DNA-binding transcriptional regulator YafY
MMRGATVRKSPLARPPLERMLRIHQGLQAGGYPSADDLALEMEVSRKSVYRDLEFMRSRLDLPIEYCARKRGFFYSQEVSAFPTLQITEGELIALVVAEKALQQYRGTSFERPLLSAFRKMAESLPETISVNLEEWQQTISFRMSAQPIIDLDVLDRLARATAQCRQLLLNYRKPGQQTAESRKVDPYHLANINGEWFLFAFCHLRQDIRTFVPARILAVEETGEVFVRPQSFSLQRRLRSSFGVHSGGGECQVRIRFEEVVADYIREKQWHPSQTLTELPEGGVELSLRLSSVVEIQRWVLGWGGYAVVLEPAELVAAVREAADRILQFTVEAKSRS